jgi:hypothetical protein
MWIGVNMCTGMWIRLFTIARFLSSHQATQFCGVPVLWFRIVNSGQVRLKRILTYNVGSVNVSDRLYSHCTETIEYISVKFTYSRIHLYCTVHCNIIMQRKPIKFSFYKLILVHIFWSLLHVSNPKVHIQEEAWYYVFYIHRYKKSCR